MLILLDISYCSIITDSGVTALANGSLSHLQPLGIGGSVRNITDLGVSAIANGNLPNLQSLDIRKCSNITDSRVAAIRAKRPKLRVVL